MSDSDKAPLWCVAPFAVTFLDSALAYFMRPLGLPLTLNAIVPALLLLCMLRNRETLRVPKAPLVLLSLLAFSFLLAIVTANNIGWRRVFETGSCVAAFFAGYVLWRSSSNAEQLGRWLIAFSAIYVAICLVALSGLDPVHFPVKSHYWSQDGLAQARPMVTADSNMEIYYLFPVVLALALPFRVLRTTLTVVTLIGALYVLTQLQTRSGMLVLGGMAALSLIAPLWVRELGRAKTVVYPILAAVAAIAFWPIIYRAAELLLYRFSLNDVVSGNGRLGSTAYAFENLSDPYWWLPRGSEAFEHRYGGLPHSNLTAVFLDGGLTGLVAWLGLVLLPVLQGAGLLLRRRLDPAAAMALIGATGVLAVQLSLHNPMRDQVWLWAGVLTGALARLREGDARAAPRVDYVVRVEPGGILRAVR